jgi:hypothetical protein
MFLLEDKKHEQARFLISCLLQPTDIRKGLLSQEILQSPPHAQYFVGFLRKDTKKKKRKEKN